MYTYDSFNELDSENSLPLNRVTTIKIDKYRPNKIWTGCSNGQVFRIDPETLAADFESWSMDCKTVCDISINKNIAVSLTNKAIEVFKLTEDDKPSSISSKNFKKSILNNICPFKDEDYFLFGGPQDKIILFNIETMSAVKNIILHQSVSSCLKMRNLEYRNSFATSCLSGVINVFDKRTFTSCCEIKTMYKAMNDFDVLAENYIIATGFEETFSSVPARRIKIYDMRNNRELFRSDDNRFFKPYFVKSFNKSQNQFICISKEGIVELSQLAFLEIDDNFKKVKSYNSKYFSFELKQNVTITDFDFIKKGKMIVVADKNGYVHISKISKEGHTTNHIPINDIVVDPDDSAVEPQERYIEVNNEKSYKISPHFFFNYNPCDLGYAIDFNPIANLNDSPNAHNYTI